MSKIIFQDIDKRLKADIRRGFQAKNINASGNASRSLRSVITDKSYTLFGANYIDFAEVGRGKGEKSKGYIFHRIYEWLQYKKYGITYSDDKERRSIAFLIMRKITQKGSYKFRNPSARTNVIETAINDINSTIKEQFIIFTKESTLKQLRDIYKL